MCIVVVFLSCPLTVRLLTMLTMFTDFDVPYIYIIHMNPLMADCGLTRQQRRTVVTRNSPFDAAMFTYIPKGKGGANQVWIGKDPVTDVDTWRATGAIQIVI